MIVYEKNLNYLLGLLGELPQSIILSRKTPLAHSDAAKGAYEIMLLFSHRQHGAGCAAV